MYFYALCGSLEQTAILYTWNINGRLLWTRQNVFTGRYEFNI